MNLEKYSDCYYCIHSRGYNVGSCDAFPDIIPMDIASGQFNHHNAYKGDKGLRFKLDEDKLAAEKKVIKELDKGRD